MDPSSVNIPEIIKEGKDSDEFYCVKQIEDMLEHLYKTYKKSSFNENPKVFLWGINEHKIQSLILNINDDNIIKGLNDFDINIENLIKSDIVVTGSYIRSVFQSDDDDNVNKINKEIILDSFNKEIDWNTITNLDKFKESEEYYFRIIEDKKITINKKINSSPSSIILKNNYLHRIGFFNNDFYVSSMFLLEYNKNLDIITSSICDPIFNIPVDLFGIYQKKQKIDNIFNLIKKKDLKSITNIKKNQNINHNELQNSITPIEYAINLFINETHPVIIDQLRQIILYLNSFSYIRPPFFYAKYIDLPNKDLSLFNQLKLSLPIKYKSLEEQDMTIINNKNEKNYIDNINNFIINYFIEIDSPSYFYEYINYISKSIDKKIIDSIIKYNSDNIIIKGIESDILNDYTIYKIAIYSEKLDILKLMKNEINIETAVNFLEDTIKMGLCKSFYFLYKLDKNILTTNFEDDNTLLHLINNNGKYQDLINIIVKLDKTILNKKNNFNETPLMYHSKKNILIVKELLKYEQDPNFFDNDGNSFIHNLVKLGDYELLKISLHLYPDLLNIENKKKETPILISAKEGNEDIFYLLKGMQADLNKSDIYGNTIYHYICKNEICIGMTIENKENLFGFTPLDYNGLADSYYYFI